MVMKITVMMVIFLLHVSWCSLNNVCRTIEDYRTILHNTNCWYNPDVGALLHEIAKHHGYPFEYHRVVTEDGYILTLFRVPNNETNSGVKRRPVILWHGFAFDGTTFMVLGNQSLVFFLSRQGFDVWIPNIRGTKYSPGHRKYNVYDARYWDFSLHENAIYDVPAVLDYVSEHAGGQKISFLGYSMGSTLSYIYASIKPQHAERRLSAIVSMAPIAFMDHSRSFAKPLSVFLDQLKEALAPVLPYGIGPNTPILINSLTTLGSVYPGLVFGHVFGAVVSGVNPNEIRPEDIPVVFSHSISGVSFKTVIHYGQFLRNNWFKPYDYGPEKNLKIYNSILPPDYNVSKITVPVHLFYGKNDFLSEEKDVINLYNLLTTKKTMKMVFEDEENHYSHLDFSAGKSSTKLYKLMLRYL